MVGGWDGSNDLKTAELIPNRCSIPSLPKGISEQPSLILTNDNNILLCGGTNNEKQCLQLKEKNWVHHSDLIDLRRYATAITMAKGTFLFGGSWPSQKTWEWLPSGSSTWVYGGSIPHPGINYGCGVLISSTEILLIGGEDSKQRILKFNVETEEWTEMNETLQPGRYHHSCVVFKNSIFVSGGQTSGDNVLKSTQILDKDNLSISYSSDLKEATYGHGLVIAHYNNQPTVLAIGGGYYQDDDWVPRDSIEVWDPETKTWSLTNDLALSEAKYNFGALSLPTRLVCP